MVKGRQSLGGQIQIPPSKSHTLRAILMGALALGASQIDSYLLSPDSEAMIRAVEQFGAKVVPCQDHMCIQGVSGKVLQPQKTIDCGNSGQVLRFVGAVAATLPGETYLTGDTSLQTNRPVGPLLSGLNQLGASARSLHHAGYAPIVVCGPWTKSRARIEGIDSQPVSGLLLAAAAMQKPLFLDVVDPKELPWIDLTLNWLQKLGVSFIREGYTRYVVLPKGPIQGFSMHIPGDWSSAAFPLAAAFVTQGALTLGNLDVFDCQGDKQILHWVREMGGEVEEDVVEKQIHVRGRGKLRGIRVDMDACIDALPILAVLGCFADGTTHLYNASIARKKESDRIATIVQELRKMGAKVEEYPDGLIVHSSPLQGADLYCHKDHRIGMSLVIAALGAKGESRISGVECFAKSYPGLIEALKGVGAKMEREGICGF